MADVFISYSTKDRDAVWPIVRAFEAAGISVWWDQYIPPDGREWSPEIESALASSRYVVALLTKNTTASERYYVPAEMRRAHALDKLVPIKVGEFTLSLLLESLVIGRQMVFVPSFELLLRGDDWKRLCSVIGNRATLKEVRSVHSNPDWAVTLARVPDLSLSLAIAVAESASLSTLMDIGRDLERRLKVLLEHKDLEPTTKALSDFLVSRTHRLSNIDAVVYSEKHGRLEVDVECVRFIDPQKASNMLLYVWDEFDEIRPTIVEWVDHLTHTLNADVRQRVGLMIGALARKRFTAVFEAWISRWILDTHPATRDVADLALSVAVFETKAKSAVFQIVRDLSTSHDLTRLRAAIELACGYTGSRLEGLSINTLRSVTQSEHTDFKVLDVMQNAIEFMIQASLAADDSSLFDLSKLIEELSVWAQESGRKTPQRLPMYLFLSVMEKLPIGAPPNVAGSLSLEALLARSTTRFSTAAVFNVALRDPGDEIFNPRDAAQEILRNWQIQEPWNSKSSAIFMQLIAAVMEICDTQRDRDRLCFMVRRRYTREQIEAASSSSTAL